VQAGRARGLLLGLALLLLDFGLGDIRVCHRQRHVLAGLDHVELARKQHDEASGMADATGDPRGIIAGPPIEVGARWPDDGRAGVLRAHLQAERRVGLRTLDRQARIAEEWRAVHVDLIDRDRVARYQRTALRAARTAIVRQAAYPK